MVLEADVQKQEKIGKKQGPKMQIEKKQENIGKQIYWEVLCSPVSSLFLCPIFFLCLIPMFPIFFLNIFNFYRNSRKLCIITLEGTHGVTSTEHRNMRCKMAHPDIKKTLNRTIPLVKIMTKNASYRGWLRNPAPPWMVQTCRNPLNNGK